MIAPIITEIMTNGFGLDPGRCSKIIGVHPKHRGKDEVRRDRV